MFIEPSTPFILLKTRQFRHSDFFPGTKNIIEGGTNFVGYRNSTVKVRTAYRMKYFHSLLEDGKNPVRDMTTQSEYYETWLDSLEDPKRS